MNFGPKRLYFTIENRYLSWNSLKQPYKARPDPIFRKKIGEDRSNSQKKAILYPIKFTFQIKTIFILISLVMLFHVKQSKSGIFWTDREITAKTVMVGSVYHRFGFYGKKDFFCYISHTGKIIVSNTSCCLKFRMTAERSSRLRARSTSLSVFLMSGLTSGKQKHEPQVLGPLL